MKRKGVEKQHIEKHNIESYLEGDQDGPLLM